MSKVRIALELMGVLALAMLGVSYFSVRHKTIILPHYVFLHNQEKGSLFLQGTWLVEDDQMGLPNQTSSIDCSRSTRMCTEASAVLDKDQLMPVGINRLYVRRWDSDIIIVDGSTSACTLETYQISISNKIVTGVVSGKEGCLVDPKPKRMRLIDGRKRSLETSGRLW